MLVLGAFAVGPLTMLLAANNEKFVAIPHSREQSVRFQRSEVGRSVRWYREGEAVGIGGSEPKQHPLTRHLTQRGYCQPEVT